MGYTLKSGIELSEEDIERIVAEVEQGNLPGAWTGKPVVGRPRLTDEPLVTVPVKFPRSIVDQIDAIDTNRSDFIRGAVIARLADTAA